MKKFRLLSAFLAFLMLLGSLTVLPASAADTKKEEEEEEESKATIDYMGEVLEEPEQKLDTMTEYVTSKDGRYTILADPYSGEVAWRDNKVGQTLFTNPYNINAVSKSSSVDTKSKLLSQVAVKYLDNGKECTYYSYVESAEREQIKLKNIKNGLRVEYSIGREETRKLVPKLIEKSRFEEVILAPMLENDFVTKKMKAFYSLKDPDDPTLTTRGLKEMQSTFKITQKMAVYVFDPYATDRELNLIESYIIEYCPTYTYDELDKDHEMTEYTGSDRAPALFKMALEYYLEDGTLRVRFPVNGFRFDDTAYQLTNIQILPYFGCSCYDYNGYMFLPDGSGTLIRAEDFADLAGKTVTTQVYGQDYAFYQISGEHQEVCRMPVYGIIENTAIYTPIIEMIPIEEHINPFTGEIETGFRKETIPHYDYTDIGFFAVIEEGESIAKISSETGGRTSHYNTVYTTIIPRQRDSYDISEAVSGAGSSMWTVTSKRKYTGNYTIRYTMLNDKTKAEEAGLKDDEYYHCDYMGMVNIMRDYLEKNEIVKRLTKDDVKADIPLYIEAFGTMEVQEKVLSFPVTKHTPLTTFEDLKAMTSKLEEAGITNVNYKLTGFFNGGMKSSIPYKAEVEENVGGADGFKDFMTYAKEKGIGVYPEFDFVWADATENDIFTGLNKKKHIIKSMNTKYARLREYSPQYQSYGHSFYLAITPAYYDYFFETFKGNYNALNPIGISASTLGQYLNSDFDKKEPYNRADNQEYTARLFQSLKDNYQNVMTEGGNYYTLPYVTDILNMPLDSSEYLNTSETIPFLGMVLHGYVKFAGMAMNNAGDINYQILKAIENGAGCYFQLSYENTNKLKVSEDFSKYYSINFDIWYEDLVDAYKTLNEATKDLQTKLIVNHEFIKGERVLTDEQLAELDAEIARIREAQAEAKRKNEEEKARQEAEEALKEELGGDEEPKEGEETTDPKEETPEEPEDPEEGGDVIIEEEIVVDEEKEIEELKKARTETDNVVRVTYEGGVTFILNYNNFDVKVDGTLIPKNDFVKLK